MSLDTIVAELFARNVRLVVHHGVLHFSPADLPAELLAGLREHKAELAAMLTPPTDDDRDGFESDFESHLENGLDPFENAIEPPPPCPSCGTLELWQTLLGDWRCLRCDPPLEAARWRGNAQRLKKRLRRIAPDARSATASTQVSTG